MPNNLFDKDNRNLRITYDLNTLKYNKKYDDKLVTQDILKVFNEAPPGSVIQLPARNILLPAFEIKSAIRIKGQPGT